MSIPQGLVDISLFLSSFNGLLLGS